MQLDQHGSIECMSRADGGETCPPVLVPTRCADVDQTSAAQACSADDKDTGHTNTQEISCRYRYRESGVT